jgi:Protein of unknown function (DUF1761)
MESVDINWLALVVAVIINTVVGSLWYSPNLFGKEWSKLVGRKLSDMTKNASSGYALTTVGAFVQAYILAHFVSFAAYFYPTYSNFSVGVLTGLWAWIAFVAIPQGANTIFAGTRKKLWAINTGYVLIVLVINGVLLASWR